MSQFPPFPPPGRYSPSRVFAEDHATYKPQYPPSQPPTYPYVVNNNDNPPFRQSYDAYGTAPYEQPRPPIEPDRYDPYAPSMNKAYDPGAPIMRLPPPPTYTPPSHVARRSSPPRSVPSLTSRMTSQSSEAEELTLMTEMTTINLSGYTAAIYALPPSHLPIEKYVAINREDAFNLHRHFCSQVRSVWYADGSSRAGEGWCAAIEWVLDPGRSDKKMRGCVGDGDALDAELGGICKAAEGFQELLSLSIKDGKPMSHDLVIFCDSQAAIISIDTSSRPEALRFEKIWREVCTEFIQANIKLVWLPRGSEIEGYVLADKIAVVGASNAYLKRRKDGTLPEVYRRAGGGEPAPPGSSMPGPWQRGDADPSRPKLPFERPLLPPISPRLMATEDGSNALPRSEAEEDGMQHREGSIFVTHFPESATAKDLGILFAKYGNILAVDIYHISSAHPRFAFVAYTEPTSGAAAITELNGQIVNVENTHSSADQADLEVWRNWSGRLIVVPAEPSRLVPLSVIADFPALPEWAIGSSKDTANDAPEGSKTQNGMQVPQIPTARSRSSSGIDSPSPHKRARQELASQPDTKLIAEPQHVKPTTDHRTDLELDPSRSLSLNAHPHPPFLPPFPPTLRSDLAGNSTPSKEGAQPHQASPVYPPTPQTAQKPVVDNEHMVSEVPLGSGKRPLTNSAAEPQEYPIQVGTKTYRALISLVQSSFGKVDVNNWIAHSCFIASDLDQARRSLKEDLYATDGAFITGRDLEQTLSSRGFTPQRVDAFITKVLKVLDGIAMAEADENGGTEAGDTVENLQQELTRVLSSYPDQTKEAVESAARLMEYLLRGKEAQEKKRLEVERRVKVLEGMVKIGEVVGGVVRFLLTEGSA